MHILIVNHARIPVYAYGGTERVVWDLGRELAQMGHRITYLVPEGSSCDFADIKILIPGKRWIEQIPEGVDITHFHFDPHEEPSFPYLVTEHANARNPKPLPLNTVFLSENHAKRYGASCFIYNGLDWKNYGPVDVRHKENFFHFLGRASWSVKNINGAISVSRKAGVDLEILGGNRLNLKGGVRYTLSRHVHFHGMVGGKEKFSLLSRSRGLILPVRWHEPFGLAVIESLYFGCPVFSTPYGALPEIVGSDYGVLATSAAELSDAIKTRQFDPWACHEYAKLKFNSRKMADSYEDVYKKVLSGEKLNATAPLMHGQARKLPWRD